MADQNKHQQNQQQQNQNQQQHQKGGGKPSFRWPLIRSLRMGWNYLWTMADEAVLSAFYMAPIYLICYAMGIEKVEIPVGNPMALWAIGFTMFMLQNALFNRRREGG